MFGTIFRLRPKQGQEQTVEQLFQRWGQERQPYTTGFVHGYLLKSHSNPGELINVAIFDSETNFRKNAEDPAQDRWYQELRAALEADPEWNDGDVTTLAGR
jgi:quinol monooxygenase YgiN